MLLSDHSYDALSPGASADVCLRFMQSDPWWSFAMAVNVYMVFFMAYHPSYKHMWLYCLLCFGLPALPALICLFHAPNGERIYGNATVSGALGSCE